MDDHIGNYFTEFSNEFPEGNFYKVIPLHDALDLKWETYYAAAPELPRGWFELCQLNSKDRIQFSLDYWLTKLPYHLNLDKSLTTFFRSLDDIGVFLVQHEPTDPLTPIMVYSLSGNRGFYHGQIPANDSDIIDLQKVFPDIILPDDYLAFLQIHNGFCKATDVTGIINSKKMSESYQAFQEMVASRPSVTTEDGKLVDPSTLFPFYESFGMPFFQCFWDDWHPENEMGNVYYCGTENTISPPLKPSEWGPDSLAFPTFLSWLVFYLEQIV